MIGKIIKTIFSNFQTFMVIWVVIIIVNQLFIFRGCFAPYCLIAALPHTSIISALFLYFYIESENNTNSHTSQIYSPKNSTSFSKPLDEIDLDDFEFIVFILD